MRPEKFFGSVLVFALAFGLWACGDTVSSTDASKLNGLDAVPGYHPGKENSSQSGAKSSSSVSKPGSSAQESSASVEESSSSGDESSSSEVEVDFSESEILVDGSGVAVITEEYLVAVDKSVRSTLNTKKEELEEGDDPEGFSESRSTEFAVDDFDFEKNEYYCFTESEEWLAITKEKLLETKLPFLWNMPYYDSRDSYSLSFEDICVSVYVKRN